VEEIRLTAVVALLAELEGGRIFFPLKKNIEAHVRIDENFISEALLSYFVNKISK